MSYVTRSGSEFRLDGKRFRFIGLNYYPFIVNSVTQSAIQTLFDRAIAKGITVFRTWCFDGTYMPTNTAGNFRYLSGGVLNWREATFVKLDILMDEARQRGIKMILSLADDPSYNTKNIYIRWSDSIHATDYFTPVSRSVSSAVLASNVITVTTASAHGFHVGQIVTTSGANEADFNNNSAFIRSVPTATTFTYAKTAGDATATGTMAVIRNSSYKTQNFYRDTNCKTWYKEFFAQLANRTNTINGRVYKNDDTIFSWEMGNEMRYDQDNDPSINGSDSHNVSVISGLTDDTAENAWEYETSWAKEMADYFKSVDANHLVSYGDMGGTWQFATGDTVSNGSFKGLDYSLLSAIANIDYLDFHMYPNQSGTELQKFGQRLGFSNAISGAGFRAQLQDYIKVGHANGKPVVCTELGFDQDITGSTLYYPLHSRHTAFQHVFKDFFDANGDGMVLWSATTVGGTSYSIGLEDTGGEALEDNTNDTKLVSLIAQRNYQIKGSRIPVDLVNGISI